MVSEREDMGAVRLADIRVGDEVEYFIDGGWRLIDGKRVEQPRGRARVVSIYPDLKYGEYELGIRHADDTYPGEGLLRLSEVEKVISDSEGIAPEQPQ